MTRNGSTKGKIIKMIAQKQKTLSDISRELDLAPSTVSQHLQELREMGAVSEVENEHIKKWKYYKLNPDFNYAALGMGDEMRDSSFRGKMPGRVFFYAIAIVLAAVAAYFLVYGGGNVQSSSFVPIRLTDPPIVPNDTQALYINYSSVAIQTVGNAGSDWILSNASGSVNLMSLVNVSQVIAGAEVAHNSRIDAIRFNVSSADITINGTEYAVVVPSSQVSAAVSGDRNVNASSEVLVDLSPTVIATYINGSTEFVMFPSVKAIVSQNRQTAGDRKGAPTVGQRLRLNSHEIEGLYNSGSLAITGVSLSAGANGSTELSVSVRNSGNSSVGLSNILILGNQTPVTTLNITCGGAYPNSSQIAQWCDRIERAGLNASGAVWNSSSLDRIIQTPVSAGSAGSYHYASFDVLQRIAYSRGIDFVIQDNGNLTMAYKGGAQANESEDTYPYTPSSYALGAGQSATFAFSGQLSLSGNLEISLVPGAHYRIGVVGNPGVHALANVTAG
ncbi:MAG TPA: ArsR family transcriptional regulator [Candidatus Saccharimonadales bacterium]|nr:ArsR family transcriptional regulator [Candidatus Saccharimonadales bacterium]